MLCSIRTTKPLFFTRAFSERPVLYEVYNYSNPTDGEDLPWNQGQFEHTLIYRIGLRPRSDR